MGKSNAYLYYFDQHPDYPADSPQAGYGSPHGQDVAYVFKTLDASNPEIAESDLAISEAMATYWTNFAKYGNPNSEGHKCRSTTHRGWENHDGGKPPFAFLTDNLRKEDGSTVFAKAEKRTTLLLTR